MANAETRSLLERAFLSIAVGVAGAVVTSLVSFALDFPLLAMLGSPEVTLAVLSASFGVPSFWYLARHPDVRLPRRAVTVFFALLFGVVCVVALLVLLLTVGEADAPGIVGWFLFVVAGTAFVAVPTYVLLERDYLGWD